MLQEHRCCCKILPLVLNDITSSAPTGTQVLSWVQIDSSNWPREITHIFQKWKKNSCVWMYFGSVDVANKMSFVLHITVAIGKLCLGQVWDTSIPFVLFIRALPVQVLKTCVLQFSHSDHWVQDTNAYSPLYTLFTLALICVYIVQVCVHNAITWHNTIMA